MNNAVKLSPNLLEKKQQLLQLLEELGSCVVAFSGGVDSAVLAKAAFLALGEKAIAVTGSSPSVAEGEVELAIEIANQIGITHQVIETQEIENPAYSQNAPDRCFHCKTELYSRLQQLIPHLNVKTILSGANFDDLGDYRPGLQAAADHQVVNPLVECKLTKSDIRQLAAYWNLSVWDKPATPCLSSRIAYGEEVTPERLKMIDQAERFLREHEMTVVRVRYHKNDLARIEVPVESLSSFCEEPFRTTFLEHLHSIGFRYVTLDLEGFRSGNLNQAITQTSLPIVQL